MKSKVLFMVAIVAFLVLVALSPPATQAAEQNKMITTNLRAASPGQIPADIDLIDLIGNTAVTIALDKYTNTGHALVYDDGQNKAIETGGTDIAVLRKYLIHSEGTKGDHYLMTT
jgi:hypothetical protein